MTHTDMASEGKFPWTPARFRGTPCAIKFDMQAQDSLMAVNSRLMELNCCSSLEVRLVCAQAWHSSACWIMCTPPRLCRRLQCSISTSNDDAEAQERLSCGVTQLLVISMCMEACRSIINMEHSRLLLFWNVANEATWSWKPLERREHSSMSQRAKPCWTRPVCRMTSKRQLKVIVQRHLQPRPDLIYPLAKMNCYSYQAAISKDFPVFDT